MTDTTLLALDPRQVIGNITPPPELSPYIAKGYSGAGGLSLLINNAVTLLYEIAAIAFFFMVLWAAFDWLTSGGDKEKIAGAQKRITYAIIGLALFALIYAILNLLGNFLGFTFFTPFNDMGSSLPGSGHRGGQIP